MNLLPFLALLACGGGCGEDPAPAEVDAAPAAPRADLPHVVMITLDTTRADRIGSYGRAEAATDTLDALAAKGQRFDRAYAHTPLTIPSHSSLFTGLFPFRHSVRTNGDNVLADEFETLAEILQANGYATAASISAFVTQRQWGFAQGFDAYYDQIQKTDAARESQWKLIRSAEEVVDDALGWLDERSDTAPLFLWVHLYDAHHPLTPPTSYITEAEARGGDAYDAAIAYMDDQIQRVMDAMPDDRETIWVVVSDHGEGQGGHLELGHGLFLYNGTQRVPLTITGPGFEPGVIEQPVGLVDVMPTLLDALEIPFPAGLDGTIQPGAPHPQYLESYELQLRFRYSPHIALVDGDRKLIATPRPELYDQTADVREITDLAESEPETVASLQQKLAALEVPEPVDMAADLDPDTFAQLQALGYISAGFDEVSDEEMPDPKDRMHIIKLLQQSERARHTEKYEEEMGFLRTAIEQDPNITEAYLRLSRRLAEHGQGEEARAVILQALERRPDSESVMVAAIALHGQAGMIDDALALAAQGVEDNPGSAALHEMYVVSLINKRRVEEAFEVGLAFLELNPDAHGVAAMLGGWLASRDRWPEAAPLLLQAGEAHEPQVNVQRNLGAMAAMAGELDDAIGYFEAELEDYPANLDARVLLARVHAQKQDYDAQLAQIEQLLEARPQEEDYYHGKSVALLNKGDADGSLAAAKAGLEHAPEHPGLLLMVANALSKQGKPDEAKAAFEIAKAAKARRDERIAARIEEVREQVSAGKMPAPFWLKAKPQEGAPAQE